MSTIKNKNAIILAFGMELEKNSKQLTKEVQDELHSISKNLKSGVDFDIDTDSLKKLQAITEAIRGSLKNIHLSEQFAELTSVLANGESSAKEYEKAISKVYNKLTVLSKFTSKRSNSSYSKILPYLDSGQVEKTIELINKLDQAETALESKRQAAAEKINSIKDNSNISERNLGYLVSKDSYKSPEEMGEILKLDEKQIEANKTNLQIYSRLCALSSSLLEDKKQLSDIQTTNDAEKAIKINNRLLQSYKMLSALENKFAARANVDPNNLLSRAIFGATSEKDLQKELTESGNAYKNIVLRTSQETVAQAQNNITQQLTKFANSSAGKISKLQKKITEKIDQSSTAQKDGTQSSIGSKDSLISEASSQIEKYIVDIDTCIAKIDELENHITDNDIDPDDDPTYLEEQLKYYTRLKELTNNDPSPLEKQMGKGYVEDFEAYLQDKTWVSTATQKAIDEIQKYGKEVQQTQKDLVGINVAGTAALSNSIPSDFVDRLENVETTLSEAQNRISALETASSAFDTITSKVDQLDNSLERVVDKLGNIEYFSNKGTMAYHTGNLDELSTTHKSESWTDRIDALRYGGYGAWGTGTYLTSNLDDLPHRGKTYAVDLSRYQLFVNKTAEQAARLNQFLSTLEKFVLSSSDYRKFDEELKLQNVDVDSLFKDYSEIFTEVKIDIATFKKFVSDMQALVKKSGIDSEGIYHLPDNSELNFSDSIPTRFMKLLGYQGVSNVGIEGYDNVEHGSVIYDLNLLDPYIKKFTDYNELLASNRKLLELNSKIDPIPESTLPQLEQTVAVLTNVQDDIKNTAQDSMSQITAMDVDVDSEISSFDRLKTALHNIVDEIDQKNNLLNQESTIANTTVTQEIALFDQLKTKINEVKSAIDSKNDSLSKEEEISRKITEAQNQAANSGSSSTRKKKNAKNSDSKTSQIDQQETLETIIARLKEYETIKMRIAQNNALDEEKAKVKSLREEIEKLQDALSKTERKSISKQLESVDKKAEDELKKRFKVEKAKLEGYIGNVESQYTSKEKLEQSKTKDYGASLKELDEQIKKLKKIDGNAKFQSWFNEENQVNVKNYKAEIERLLNVLKDPAFNLADLGKMKAAQTSWKKWRQNNSKANKLFGSKFDDISAQFVKITDGSKVAQAEFDALNDKVIKLKNDITSAGKTGKSFKDIWSGRMKSLAAWLTSFVSFQEVINIFKRGFSYIKDFDSAMTDLHKVTDATDEELNEFQSSVSSIASGLGALTNNVVQSTTEWSRLGYAIDQATKLAEASTIYANVGDIDATTASTDLVSAMKAFDIEAENAMKIVDSLNEIGNNYAVSSAQLGEILERSSSALAVSGDSIDQVIAMGAAMNEIVQDSSITGTTIKMLALRIRGARTEIEEMGESTDGMAESTSKLRDQIKALTNVDGTGGFDIMLDDRTFKTTYDIVKGISNVWAKMSQIDQSALLELIAGKNRAQGAAALIKNFAQAENALIDSQNSEGSALKENERYMESIEGHLNVLANEYRRIWTEGINRDFVNFWIDAAKGVAEFANKLGLAKIALGLLSVASGVLMTKQGMGFVNKDTNGTLISIQKLTQTMQEYNDSVVSGKESVKSFLETHNLSEGHLHDYFLNLKNGTASMVGYGKSVVQTTIKQAAMTATTVLLNAALSALTAGLVWLIGAGLSKLWSWLDKEIVTTKEAAKQTEALTQSLHELHSTINGDLQNIDKLSKRYAELSDDVDALGKNVSLTDEEYSEYLNISNELAKLTPSLVDHWDEQGNAILKTIDHVKELTEAYKEEAQWEASRTISSGKDEEGNEFSSIFTNYEANTSKKPLGFASPNDKRGWLNEFLTYTPSDLNKKRSQGVGNQDRNLLDDLLEKNGIISVTEDNLAQVRHIIEMELQAMEATTKESAEAIGAYALTCAQTWSEYWSLDGETYSAVNTFLKNLSPTLVDGLQLFSESATQDFITSLIQTLSNADSTKIDEALLNLFSVDISSKSIPEAQEYVQKYADIMVDELKRLNPESTVTADDILSLFGLDNITALFETYNTNLDNWSTSAAGVMGQGSDALRQQIDAFATEYSINTQNEIALFNDCMEEAKYDINEAFKLYLQKSAEKIDYNANDIFQLKNSDDVLTDLGKLNEQLETIQSAYSTLKDAMDTYSSAGAITVDQLQSILEIGDDFLDYLTLEEGQLSLNEQAVYDLAAARLAEMKYQVINGIIDNVQNIQSEADANVYLASTTYELSDAYEHLAQSKLAAWKADMLGLHGEQTWIQDTYDKALNDIKKVNILFDNVDLTSLISGDSGSGSGSATSDFAELFDFFERRLEIIQQSLDLLDANLENVFGSSARNTLLSQQTAIIQEEMRNYSEAEKMYNEAANHYLSRLDAKTQEQIKNGSLDVTALIGESGEAINENLEGYVEWANKAADCKQQLAELKETLRQIELDKFNNIIEDYTNQFDLFGQSIDLIQQQISFLETAGQIIPESFYTTQIEQTQKQLSTLETQKAALIKQMQDSLASGLIEAGTDEWLEMVNAVADVESNILDCKTSIEELDNSLLQLRWDTFDRVQDQFKRISEEASKLADLFNDTLDIQVSDGKGTWTNEALGALGLYAQQLEGAQYNVEKYNTAIAELNQLYAEGKYSTTEYLEKLAELERGRWDAIDTVESMEDAIVSLNETRVNEGIEVIQEEIDAYKELTDAQIEALDAAEDLHGYQRTIAEKTKAIADIERQLAAIQYDNSAAAIAKRKQLEEQYAEAQDDLAETERDHSVETQKDGLNKQYENFEEARNKEIVALKETLNNRELLISQSFNTVLQNSETVAAAIERIAQQSGISVSDSLISAWKSGENALAGYGQALSAQSSAFIATLSGIENEMWNLQNQSNQTYGAIAQVFASQSDNLVAELLESYTSTENLNSMAQALRDSFVQALSGPYDVSGIVSALNAIEEAAKKAGDSMNKIPHTSNTGTSGGGGIANGPGTDRHDVTVKAYAKGGLVTKDESNPLNHIARAVGEDSLIAAKEGESILTPIQTEAMIKLAPFLSKLKDNFSLMSSLSTFKNTPFVESVKSAGNHIQVGSLVTVNGNVDDTNLKKITDIVRKEMQSTFTKWNRDFVYNGY